VILTACSAAPRQTTSEGLPTPPASNSNITDAGLHFATVVAPPRGDHIEVRTASLVGRVANRDGCLVIETESEVVLPVFSLPQGLPFELSLGDDVILGGAMEESPSGYTTIPVQCEQFSERFTVEMFDGAEVFVN